MSLTDITNKIIKNAAREKEAVEKEAAREVEHIRAEAQVEKDRLFKNHRANLEREMDHRLKQARSLAEQEMKLALESIRRKHIDKVFSDAKKQLTDLPSAEYRALIASFLSEIPKGIVGTVYAPGERLEDTRQAFLNVDLDLAVEPDKNITGGFRITGQEADYDYTFDRLIDDMRDKYELDVARALFHTSTQDAAIKR